MLGRIFGGIRQWWNRVQPAFWRRMGSGYRAAVVILMLVVVWIGSGVFGGHQEQTAQNALAKTSDVSRVQVKTLIASPRDAMLTVRGRTQALHWVDTRAQVDGIVRAIHFEKGDRVKAGDALKFIEVPTAHHAQTERRRLASARDGRKFFARFDGACIGVDHATDLGGRVGRTQARRTGIRRTRDRRIASRRGRICRSGGDRWRNRRRSARSHGTGRAATVRGGVRHGRCRTPRRDVRRLRRD